MGIKTEKQFDLFLDNEYRSGKMYFVTYVIDIVNKVLFPVSSKHVMDSVKQIKDILNEYEVENIYMYCKNYICHFWDQEISINTDYNPELAYDVRGFRDQLRKERNQIRNKTNPVFYYEAVMQYELMSKEMYDSNDKFKRVDRIAYDYSDLYTLFRID